MKYLQSQTLPGVNECAGDAEQSARLVQLHADELQTRIDKLADDAPTDERLHLLLDHGYAMLELNRIEEAWQTARGVLDEAIEAQLWLRAVEACDILFQADRPESIQALAHGIWLSVTFPVDPELSVAMLQHLVEESPDRSDGAAVAAATASYIVNLRAEGKQRQDLQFFTGQLLGEVARRHSQVEDQEIFDFWVQQLELDDPDKFLPRLAKVLELLVEERWWYDRDRLRNLIPG